MNKKKIAEIVKFNVEKSIQNKWFVIFNIIMCLIVIIGTNIENIDRILEQNDINLFEEEFKLEIIDPANLSAGMFEEFYGDVKGVEISYVFENNYTKENIPDDVIVIEYELDIDEILITKVTSKEATDNKLYNNILKVSKDIRSRIYASKIGTTPEELKKLNENPKIEEIMLGVDAENSATKEMIKFASVIIVYFVLILVLSRIANEIAQEKISKSIEYVLTSVSAKEYLLAKVLGVTITIIVQLLYSAVYYLIGNGINIMLNISNISNTATQTSAVGIVDINIVTYILAMAGYLIFTVFLMCLIQAAISSKTTSVAEASNTTTMLLMLTIILYFISLSAIGPYINVTPMMYVISCLPIVSTFFVPAMMIIGQATGIQIFVSFVLLIMSVPLVFDKCSQKFKDGILDYTSQKTKNKKIRKNRTLKEEQEYLMKSSKMKRFAFVIGMSLLLWIILQNVGGMILPSITNNLLSGKISDSSITWIYFIIISIVSLIIPTVFVSSYTEEGYKKTEKSKSTLKVILIGWGIIIIIRYLEQYILTLIGSDYSVLTNDMIVDASNSLLDKILFFIGLAVVPGIFEELFVRKSIINYSKQFGNYFSIIISAIIFGLLHLNLQQGIFAFLLGIVFAIIVLKTKDIRITIILHIMNNGLVALYSIFSSNILIQNILEYGSIALGIIGIVLLLETIIKNKGKNRLFEKEKFQEEYKMIFKNFTFDLVIVLFIVLTIATESYLRVL